MKITGLKEGNAIIKIDYNTGDVEKLYVEVSDSDDEYEGEVTMEVNDTYKVYIDLDDYDADEAKITYDSEYVSVSKTKFTSTLLVSRDFNYLDAKHSTLMILISSKTSCCCCSWTFKTLS